MYQEVVPVYPGTAPAYPGTDPSVPGTSQPMEIGGVEGRDDVRRRAPAPA
jgi:hypothetical protein